MNTRRILMLVLLTAAVCLVGAGVGAAEDVNITLEGQYGGVTEAVAISGNYAYVGQGQDFVVLDISNPLAPVELRKVIISSMISDIVVLGDYAYVANLDNGLVVIDISDPMAPTLAGSYDTAGNAKGVAVSGSYAYVADSWNGLFVIDISDSMAPTLAGSYSTGGHAEGVAVSGSYAYVADGGNGLVIVDISNPAEPTLVGSIDTAGYAGNVAVLGSYAYVTDDRNGLVIVDISNPMAPTFAGSYETGGITNGVVVSGSYAYVADYYNGLVVIDISNPAEPTFAGSYDTAGHAYGVAVSGSYVYVADFIKGLLVVNISNPMAPTLAGRYDTAGYAQGVTISGSYAYVALDDNGLVVVDICNPTAPTLAGRYDTAGRAFSVAVSGSYTHVADGFNGLVILRTDASTSSSVHNINKGTDYITIQAAIDDASLGDEIHVDSGTYYENVIIDKQIILCGIDTGSGMPIVHASNIEWSFGFSIIADGVILDGFEIVNSTCAGVSIGGENCKIINNKIIPSNLWGVLLFSNNSIIDNNIIVNAKENITEACELDTGGILNFDGSFNYFGNNTISNGFFGISDATYYMSYGPGQKPFLGNLTVFNNTINGSINGISLYGSNHSQILRNRISNSRELILGDISIGSGIILYSNNCDVKENEIVFNKKSGIYIVESTQNKLSNNNISNNEIGIVSTDSTDNLLYHNNIFDNILHNSQEDVCTSGGCTNFWDNDASSGGNYWGDYTGIDADNDGIGDTPYIISGAAGARDRYPLMEPWAGNYSETTGDLNHNGMLDTGDVTLVLRMAVGLVTQDLLGDMNSNGFLDTGDATLILRTIVGLE